MRVLFRSLYPRVGALTSSRLTGFYKKITNLKYQGVWVVLSVGGWGESSNKYSTMMKDVQRRQNFVVQATDFVRQYGFQGLDLDLEYPGAWNVGIPNLRSHKILILQVPGTVELILTVKLSRETPILAYPKTSRILSYCCANYDRNLTTTSRRAFFRSGQHCLLQ